MSAQEGIENTINKEFSNSLKDSDSRPVYRGEIKKPKNPTISSIKRGFFAKPYNSEIDVKSFYLTGRNIFWVGLASGLLYSAMEIYKSLN